MEDTLLQAVTTAFNTASEAFPYDSQRHLEVKPGVRVPTDGWNGYRMMCATFYDDENDELLSRMRKALAVHHQVMTEIAEGGIMDLEEVDNTLRDIIFAGLQNDDKGKKAIIHGVKTDKKKVKYLIEQSDGEDKSFTKYELKKKYPDQWQQMLRDYQKIHLKTRDIGGSESPFSSDIEGDIDKGYAKNGPTMHREYRRDDEMHQGSTMMGSSDEKKMRVAKARRKAVEGHGEGGYVNRYDEDLRPKPATVYGGFRKRLSEPPFVGRSTPLMHSPHNGTGKPGSDAGAKRVRQSFDGPPLSIDFPYVTSSQTDTAATAWNLLSKIMSNENRLIAALDDEKAKNEYLEKLLMEAEGHGLVHLNDIQIQEHEEALTKELEEKAQELTSMKSKLLQSQGKQELAASKLAQCEKDLKDAKAQLAPLRDRNKQIMMEYEETLEALSNAKAEMENEKQLVAAASKELKDANAETHALKKENNRLTRALASAEQNIVQKTSKCKELEKSLSDNQQRMKKELEQSLNSQKIELKSMADTLLKERVEADARFEQMKDAQNTLKKQLANEQKESKGIIASLTKENRILHDRIASTPLHHDANAMDVINQALKMQKESRDILDILKRGDSLEIATFYENIDDDAGEGHQEDDHVRKWLRPSHWKDCRVVGAKMRDGELQYKCVNSKTKESTYLKSSDMQKWQFCLLSMLQYMEERTAPLA